MTIQFLQGIPEEMRQQAVQLYEEGFGLKFAAAIPSPCHRIALLSESLNLNFAVAAVSNDQLVGLAGYTTSAGSLTEGMTYRRLIQHLGLLRGHWATLIFSLYERQLCDQQLLMDGIVVTAEMRGQGVGTGLLSELATLALSNGYTSLRLDVVDTNPQARRMYERYGFRETQTERFEYLRWLLGFGASATLVLDLQNRVSNE